MAQLVNTPDTRIVKGFKPIKTGKVGRPRREKIYETDDQMAARLYREEEAKLREQIKKERMADKLLSGKLKDSRFGSEMGQIEGIHDGGVVDTSVIYDDSISHVTATQLKRIYPVKVGKEALERCAEMLNKAIEDHGYFGEFIRDNTLGFIDILKNTNKGISFRTYLDAVKFCTYKMSGNSNVKAYCKAFPDRVAKMEANKTPNDHLVSYANSYSRNKMVTEVMAKIMIPDHIMFQEYFHLAVKTQVELMTDTNVSPKVRSDAANSLMTHLKQPEIKKAELTLNTNDSAINDLANALSALSQQQQTMLSNGQTNLKDISEAVIIEVETDEPETDTEITE